MRAAGTQISRSELIRYLAELAWAPHAIGKTVEVSAERVAGPARVRLVFENGDVVRI
jgi:hypothetical protein